jgi:hypothetical protein
VGRQALAGEAGKFCDHSMAQLTAQATASSHKPYIIGIEKGRKLGVRVLYISQ